MQHDGYALQKPWDLIIIGAGISGIQVARTYFELYPTRDVAIFKAANSIGSVQSRQRVYRDFWTQTPRSILEFSDQPIHEIHETDQYFGFFKATHVTQYLKRYCSNHVYNRTTLSSRIHLNTSVTSVHELSTLRMASDLASDILLCRLWTHQVLPVSLTRPISHAVSFSKVRLSIKKTLQSGNGESRWPPNPTL
jgi:cation diffusion facilitator CzcD-associated flavoprotein CzcO